jgi:hypothetical protein
MLNSMDTETNMVGRYFIIRNEPRVFNRNLTVPIRSGLQVAKFANQLSQSNCLLS